MKQLVDSMWNMFWKKVLRLILLLSYPGSWATHSVLSIYILIWLNLLFLLMLNTQHFKTVQCQIIFYKILQYSGLSWISDFSKTTHCVVIFSKAQLTFCFGYTSEPKTLGEAGNSELDQESPVTSGARENKVRGRDGWSGCEWAGCLAWEVEEGSVGELACDPETEAGVKLNVASLNRVLMARPNYWVTAGSLTHALFLH